MARAHTLIVRVVAHALATLSAVTAAGCGVGRGSGLQGPQGPPRSTNRIIVSGMVRSPQGAPVAGARVVAELSRRETPNTAADSCMGRPALQREAVSSATGQFDIPLESAGPQFDACLVVRIVAPVGSGLKDTTVSGQRFRFAVPRTPEVPSVRLEVVLSERN